MYDYCFELLPMFYNVQQVTTAIVEFYCNNPLIPLSHLNGIFRFKFEKFDASDRVQIFKNRAIQIRS